MSETHTDHRGRPRVVVTGIGLKSPAGNDVESCWSRLLAGESAAAPIRNLDATALPVRIACEVPDFDTEPYFGAKEARRLDRVTQLGLAAAVDALADAGDVRTDPARCAVIAGTGVGGLATLEEQERVYHDKGPSRVSPFFVPMMMANRTAGEIAMRYGWTGVNLCISTACAAGAHCIGEGARLIRDGSADVVVAGGTEAAITQICMAAFARMGALSGRNDDPTHASRPFDADRDGFVMGEAAGFLVLERLDRALARDARIYAQVLGYGRNDDAHHVTAPSPGGAGAAACMQLAIDDAGLAPSALGHVNAHGTSTPLNDAAEAEAIRKVFGDDAPPVTSVKGVIGHTIGAAGAVEAIAGVLSIRDGVVPPTANHERRDADIDVDVVAGEPREIGPLPFLSNSFGFGGHNASLIIGPA
jgi:3-oxoacyl-[acyl-carrier-protein] synthase II